jgi:NodT family efflux transporter outer membrane factor (OMF) lipoprotein
MRAGWATMLAAALTLAGCATSAGPLPDAASVAVPPQFALASAPGERGELAAFLPSDDAAFAALIQSAEQGAPSAALALARVDAARAALRAAGAARAPNVTVEGGAVRSRASENAIVNLPPGTVIDPTNSSFSLGVNAAWDPDIFGRLRAGQRAAQLRLDAADADARAVRLALFSDIARGVIDYRAAEAQLAIVAQDLRDAETLAALTGARVRAGLAPGLDLVRAEGLAAAARAETGPAESARAAALGQLVTLTAMDGAAVQAAFAGAVSSAPTGLAAPVGLPADLLRHRPDIAAAEARLAAANSDVAAAAAARFPQISITSAIGVAPLALGDLFDGGSATAQLGAGVAGPLFDFGRVAAQIDAREADAQAAFQSYRQAVFQAIGEGEAALGTLAAARARLDALAEKRRIDGDTAQLATQRYRMGLSDFLSVVDAQRQLNVTRQQYLAAEAAVRQAGVSVFRSFGG